MKMESVHSETWDASVLYPQDSIDSSEQKNVRIPVVPGMKFSARYWFYIPIC